VVFKGKMNVVMTALNGSLPVATQGMVLTDKFDTMEEHMDFGFHKGSTTWPAVHNEDHQLIEFVQLLGVEGVVGKEEETERTDGLVEDVEVHPCLLVGDLINDHG